MSLYRNPQDTTIAMVLQRDLSGPAHFKSFDPEQRIVLNNVNTGSDNLRGR